MDLFDATTQPAHARVQHLHALGSGHGNSAGSHTSTSATSPLSRIVQSVVPLPFRFVSDVRPAVAATVAAGGAAAVALPPAWRTQARRCKDHPYKRVVHAARTASTTDPLATLRPPPTPPTPPTPSSSAAPTSHIHPTLVDRIVTTEAWTTMLNLDSQLAAWSPTRVQLASEPWDPLAPLDSGTQHFASRHAYALCELDRLYNFTLSTPPPPPSSSTTPPSPTAAMAAEMFLTYIDLDARSHSSPERGSVTEFVQWRRRAREKRAKGWAYAPSHAFPIARYNAIAREQASKNFELVPTPSSSSSSSPPPSRTWIHRHIQHQTRDKGVMLVVSSVLDESTPAYGSIMSSSSSTGDNSTSSNESTTHALGHALAHTLDHLAIAFGTLCQGGSFVLQLPDVALAFATPLYMSLLFVLFHTFDHLVFHRTIASGGGGGGGGGGGARAALAPACFVLAREFHRRRATSTTVAALVAWAAHAQSASSSPSSSSSSSSSHLLAQWLVDEAVVLADDDFVAQMKMACASVLPGVIADAFALTQTEVDEGVDGDVADAATATATATATASPRRRSRVTLRPNAHVFPPTSTVVTARYLDDLGLPPLTATSTTHASTVASPKTPAAHATHAAALASLPSFELSQRLFST